MCLGFKARSPLGSLQMLVAWKTKNPKLLAQMLTKLEEGDVYMKIAHLASMKVKVIDMLDSENNPDREVEQWIASAPLKS